MSDEEKWQQWKQMAKELGESTTLNEGRRAVAGNLYKTLVALDFAPERSSADPGLTNTELPQEPQFEHDCIRCVFLGQFVGPQIVLYDLYYCPAHIIAFHTIIARYGSKGNEYCSGLASAQTHPALAEAKKRAIAKRLLRY